MTAIWWIRRDLRLEDNLTLYTALEAGKVQPVFILDPGLIHEPPTRREGFLFNTLRSLDTALRSRGSYLVVRQGSPLEKLGELLEETGAQTIYAEEDFTPYARKRDNNLAEELPLHLIQGQLVHHPESIHKSDGNPYTVFTPFRKTWVNLLFKKLKQLAAPTKIPTNPGVFTEPIPNSHPESCFPASESEAQNRLDSFLADSIYTYEHHRNRLDINGTSCLSPYIHFGLLGLQAVVRRAQQAISIATDPEGRKSAQTWLNELIWREFYIHILYHFPYVLRRNFRPKYDAIEWWNDPEAYESWKVGRTGYPIVDAAMRQLTAQGWMHNRARMIVASFLVKDLLIDWRWGEQWFMKNLIDGDVAANNGGWQWTAGTGTDAAPYFRIFNPVLQSKKFDPNGDYIRKWVPELAHLSPSEIHAPWEAEVDVPEYPGPIIDHKYARERTLAAYQAIQK